VGLFCMVSMQKHRGQKDTGHGEAMRRSIRLAWRAMSGIRARLAMVANRSVAIWLLVGLCVCAGPQ